MGFIEGEEVGYEHFAVVYRVLEDTDPDESIVRRVKGS